MAKKQIIIVDDNTANLTACKKTLKDIYDVFPAPSAGKMFDILTHVTPDLILLDVEMPGMNGYEAMRILKNDDNYAEIPVIFLSAMDDAESEMEGLDLGAVDYIHKPFVSALLMKRIETHIAVIEGKKELQALNSSIDTLIAGDVDKESVKALISKTEVLMRMGHKVHAPLNIIIAMIEAAIKSDNFEDIRHYLGRADVESRLILEIVNDIIDLP